MECLVRRAHQSNHQDEQRGQEGHDEADVADALWDEDQPPSEDDAAEELHNLKEVVLGAVVLGQKFHSTDLTHHTRSRREFGY